MITEVGKWTCDARLPFQQFDLPNIPILDNTRTRIIVDLFSQFFIICSSAHDKFKNILNSEHGGIDTA